MITSWKNIDFLKISPVFDTSIYISLTFHTKNIFLNVSQFSVSEGKNSSIVISDYPLAKLWFLENFTPIPHIYMREAKTWQEDNFQNVSVFCKRGCPVKPLSR